MATSSFSATGVGQHTSGQWSSRIEETVELYTNHTTTDNGGWIDMVGCTGLYIIANGITTGTIKFTGFNTGATAPANTEHGEAAYGIATSASTLVEELTADGAIYFSEYSIPRWFKVRVTVATTITLDISVKRIRWSS